MTFRQSSWFPWLILRKGQQPFDVQVTSITFALKVCKIVIALKWCLLNWALPFLKSWIFWGHVNSKLKVIFFQKEQQSLVTNQLNYVAQDSHIHQYRILKVGSSRVVSIVSFFLSWNSGLCSVFSNDGLTPGLPTSHLITQYFNKIHQRGSF